MSDFANKPIVLSSYEARTLALQKIQQYQADTPVSTINKRKRPRPLVDSAAIFKSLYNVFNHISAQVLKGADNLVKFKPKHLYRFLQLNNYQDADLELAYKTLVSKYLEELQIAEEPAKGVSVFGQVEMDRLPEHLLVDKVSKAKCTMFDNLFTEKTLRGSQAQLDLPGFGGPVETFISETPLSTGFAAKRSYLAKDKPQDTKTMNLFDSKPEDKAKTSKQKLEDKVAEMKAKKKQPVDRKNDLNQLLDKLEKKHSTKASKKSTVASKETSDNKKSSSSKSSKRSKRRTSDDLRANRTYKKKSKHNPNNSGMNMYKLDDGDLPIGWEEKDDPGPLFS